MLMRDYLSEVRRILERVEETQSETMLRAAEKIADAVERGKQIYAFGCNHAGLLAMELFYRSGGLAVINPILAPGLTLDTRPVTLTTDMERLPGYGRSIIDRTGLASGDILLIHSVSGRNPVPIDAALRACERGAFTIALTNRNTSERESSRHMSGKRLYEVCDLVLDNCGCFGDAAVCAEGLPEKIGPTSTAVGAAIWNAVVVQSVELMCQRGLTPPVFVSSNIAGGDSHNAYLLEKYRNQILYN